MVVKKASECTQFETAPENQVLRYWRSKGLVSDQLFGLHAESFDPLFLTVESSDLRECELEWHFSITGIKWVRAIEGKCGVQLSPSPTPGRIDDVPVRQVDNARDYNAGGIGVEVSSQNQHPASAGLPQVFLY